MKRNILRRGLAFFLIIAVFIVSFYADAVIISGQWVIFTAINDEVQVLNYNTMPYMYNGQIYTPYTVFTGALDVKYVYNEELQVLVLANADSTLFFDYAKDLVHDDADREYSSKGLIHNGNLYVPARFVAQFFGLSYSYQYEVPVVRVSNSKAAFSDAHIKSTIEKSAADRIALYEQSIAQNQPGETEEAVLVDSYLLFSGELNQHTLEILDILKAYDITALFFLTENEIYTHEEIVRRIYVDGHEIGVASGSGITDDTAKLLDDFNRANEMLRQVLRTKSNWAYLPGGSLHEVYTDEALSSIAAAGYRFWDFTIAVNDYAAEATGASVLQGIQEGLIGAEEIQALILHSTAATVEALPQLFAYLEQAEHFVLDIDLLTQPIRFSR